MASSARKTDNQRGKFRDACNYCALSKVRCRSQKPTCDRCQERGLNCLYGPSNRKGRPAPKPSLSKSPSPGDTSFSSQSPDIHAWSPDNDHNIAPNWDVTCWDAVISGGSPSNVTWGPWITQSQFDSDICYTAMPETGKFLDREHSLPNFGEPIRHSSQSPHSNNSAHTAPPTAPSRGSCISEAFSALFPLHEHDQKPDALSNTPSNISQPSIDTILLTARSATATLTRLLSCHCDMCTNDHSMPSLLVAIAAKIVKWYRIVQFTNVQTTSAAPSSSTSVLVALLSTGHLDLPRETEMRMKAQLLLCEIEPLVHICHLFEKKLHSGMVGYRDEVRETFEKYWRSGLAELKKSLEDACGKAIEIRSHCDSDFAEL